MAGNPNDPQVQLTFPDGKTVTMSQSAYEADPPVEVTLKNGTTEIMPRSRFNTMQANAIEAAFEADISQLYGASLAMAGLAPEVSGLVFQAQDALASALAALGSNSGLDQARKQLQQANGQLGQIGGVVTGNINTMSQGLASTAGALSQMEQKNLEPYGRTAPDLWSNFPKLLAMTREGL